ncbi:hypothetical protein [Hasllibacter sp. MH4015]|uniref:hypothetical protein n=1 Tax=Hasllibacter sp. MH4015 TaxID=2854029 RepID=UPI001CD26F81|nr:hypothetical protein [Hasllibacter sp. MH4015]
MFGLRKPAANVIRSILETQHTALLAGDFARLEPLAAQLEQAFARLRQDGASAGELTAIKAMSARNATLLRAAQTGVARARDQLGSVRAPVLNTYDASGQSRANGEAPGKTLARR